jgi:hypothetical protein
VKMLSTNKSHFFNWLICLSYPGQWRNLEWTEMLLQVSYILLHYMITSILESYIYAFVLFHYAYEYWTFFWIYQFVHDSYFHASYSLFYFYF